MAECIVSAILSPIHIGKQLLINHLNIQQVFTKLRFILYLRINSKLIQVAGKVCHLHDGRWLLNLQCRTENSFFLLREPLNPAGQKIHIPDTTPLLHILSNQKLMHRSNIRFRRCNQKRRVFFICKCCKYAPDPVVLSRKLKPFSVAAIRLRQLNFQHNQLLSAVTTAVPYRQIRKAVINSRNTLSLTSSGSVSSDKLMCLVPLYKSFAV